MKCNYDGLEEEKVTRLEGSGVMMIERRFTPNWKVLDCQDLTVPIGF